MKKNLLYIMTGLALCATAASCSSDDDAVSAPKTLSATATIDNSNTRTTYTDQGTGSALKVDWEASETFKAYYTEGGTTPLIFTKTDGSAFVATNVPAGVSASTPFTGVYGENVTYDAATGKYTVDYSGQDGTLENLAKYDAMVATSATEGGNLKFPFKHLSAFLRVTLKQTSAEGNKPCSQHSTEEGQKAVLIKFNNCTLLDENMGITSGMNSGDYSVSFTLDSKLASTSETRVLYFAIPALSLTNASGLVEDLPAEGYRKIVKGTKSFEAGKVYDATITYTCGYVHNAIWDR